MEDYRLDIMIGEGPAARSVRLDLPPFTLVGATTRAGMLTNPLRDRFSIVSRLEFYTHDELTKIVTRSSSLLEVDLQQDGAYEIAKRSRGTPRIANRLLRRVRDFAIVDKAPQITREIADRSLSLLDVDRIGLDRLRNGTFADCARNEGEAATVVAKARPGPTPALSWPAKVRASPVRCSG